MNQTQIIGSIMAATGKTVPVVAKEYGYTKMFFYRIINGESVNHRGRNLISSITDIPVSKLWPEPQTEENHV